MTSHDTHAEAYRVQIAAYRAMSPERRGEIAAELSDAVRECARVGIRLRHPDYTDQQVAHALLEILYGTELARLSDPS